SAYLHPPSFPTRRSSDLECEIAGVRRCEYVFECGFAVIGDSSCLSNGVHALSYLALLVKRAIGAQLVVANNVGRVTDIHKLARAIIWKGERLCKLCLGRVVLCLRTGYFGRRA